MDSLADRQAMQKTSGVVAAADCGICGSFSCNDSCMDPGTESLDLYGSGIWSYGTFHVLAGVLATFGMGDGKELSLYAGGNLPAGRNYELAVSGDGLGYIY